MLKSAFERILQAIRNYQEVCPECRELARQIKMDIGIISITRTTYTDNYQEYSIHLYCGIMVLIAGSHGDEDQLHSRATVLLPDDEYAGESFAVSGRSADVVLCAAISLYKKRENMRHKAQVDTSFRKIASVINGKGIW